jgi:hypothetical protein
MFGFSQADSNNAHVSSSANTFSAIACKFIENLAGLLDFFY